MWKTLWKLLDGPLAIVVGAVALVLVVLQLAAHGLNPAVRMDAARPTASTPQAASLQCLGSGDRSTHAACLLQVGEWAAREQRDERSILGPFSFVAIRSAVDAAANPVR